MLVLVAENVGHIRGVAQLTDPSVNKLTGRALFADGLATTVAGFFGGSGTTTYGENIGVMAATKVYSTAAYWVAGIVAVLLGLSPKIGAVINTIPAGSARRRDDGALRPHRHHRREDLARQQGRLLQAGEPVHGRRRH